MSDESTSLDEFDIDELSVEDLAVLHAFEAMDQWPTQQLQQSHVETNSQIRTSTELPVFSPRDDEEMLLIFAAEVEEDIAGMHQALNQLEQHEAENLSCFITLKRVGHKLHGTAGAVGFPLISIIAAQIELLAKEVSHGTIDPRSGAQAIYVATAALEYCLQTLTSTGQEPEATSSLANLEVSYQSMHIDLQQLEQKQAAEDQEDPEAKETVRRGVRSEHDVQEQNAQGPVVREDETVAIHISPKDIQSGIASIQPIPSTRVDTRRFEHLIVHTEKLVEQRATVEEAQAQVDCALQELYTAQARLQRLEPLIAKLQKGENVALSLPERIPASSLIARILHESVPPNQRHQQQKKPYRFSAKRASELEIVEAKSSLLSYTEWDELELDRYNEQDMLQHALKDAIADLSITTANVRSAFTHFSVIQQDYLTSITDVRRDTLLLRQVPFKSLMPRLERVVKMSAPGQAQQTLFEVLGENTEIDQDILDALATPLVQLLRTCLADAAILEEAKVGMLGEPESSPPRRIWLKVTNHGNRLLFEIGFSMPIQGGAIETIRQPIQQLRGTISLQRNLSGGISFFFRIPHPHSSVSCLLVRAGDQHLLIPCNQIQHIGDAQREHTDVHYSLQELLGFPKAITTSQIFLSMTPMLILAPEDGVMEGGITGITVDEIVGEQECIVKPLAPSLQRPGIAGTTIDGKGCILLMIDLLALIRSAPHYASSRPVSDNVSPQPHQANILVTDDSAALRHSLVQTLQHASYTVFEARDGVEALEKLQLYKPDICLLDVEMPNLNGYDVLQMMSTDATMSSVKVIMLTSRSSVKHMQRALALGADAYLTKPCSQDDLFQTIELMLKK